MNEIYIGNVALWDGEEATQAFERLCKTYGVEAEVIQNLVAAQRKKQSQSNVTGRSSSKVIDELNETFDDILKSLT
jgi:hypothetical protein